MPYVRKNEITDLRGLTESFTKQIKEAVNRPTIANYKPHDKQIQFHSSTAFGRLYVGGNRAGKTVGGTVEDIWWLLNKHPYQTTPLPPVYGRVVSVDFKQGFEKIIQPEFLKWLPPSELKNGSWEDSFNNELRTLTLQNGSFVEFMSYEQDRDKFAGTSRHFIHYDEEPPKYVYEECTMRLMDVGGHWWITMTPLDGMATFVYDDIFLVGLNIGSNIDVIQVDVDENPYVTQENKDLIISLISDENEKQARKSGNFVEIGGLAFKTFRPDIHIIDSFIPNKNWPVYASFDHGFNNPTAWLFHSISPEGIVTTWEEMYDRELTVPEWARKIHERNSREDRRAPDIYVGDPSIKQRTAHHGTSIHTEYAKRGIPIVLGTNDVVSGVNKMNSYLKTNKWFITSNCINLNTQLKRVKWKTFASQKLRDANNPLEQLHKYKDHATDSARYLYSILPEIEIVDYGPMQAAHAKQTVESIINPTTPSHIGGLNIDQVLKQQFENRSTNTEWTVTDEHVGGYY